MKLLITQFSPVFRNFLRLTAKKLLVPCIYMPRLRLNAYQNEREVIQSSKVYIYVTCQQIFGYGLLIVCSFCTHNEYEGSACRHLS